MNALKRVVWSGFIAALLAVASGAAFADDGWKKRHRHKWHHHDHAAFVVDAPFFYRPYYWPAPVIEYRTYYHPAPWYYPPPRPVYRGGFDAYFRGSGFGFWISD
jgi:hypothetical protein